MNGPIDSAAKGMAQAQQQLAQSAARLTAPSITKPQFSPNTGQQAPFNSGNAKTDGDSAQPKRSTSSGAAPRAARAGAGILSGQGQYLPSLAEETVQMRLAANAYSANARLMEAAVDLQKMAQDVLGSGSEKTEGTAPSGNEEGR